MASDHHIRNPIEWGWDQLRGLAHATGSGAHAMQGGEARPVVVRRIAMGDIRDALARGFDDFAACRTDVIFLCLIYPIAGLFLARAAIGADMLPLIFPLASGFALIGPVAAMGLYEMSRRRERGEKVSWAAAFAVLRSPAIAALIVLGLALVAIFLAWLAAANLVYAVTLGPAPPASVAAFVADVFTTPAGWAMIGIGTGVGFVFAVVAFTVSVVSFPLLLDRDAGLLAAVGASVRAVRMNPAPMALWGAIVAAGLAIGSAPLFIGLAVVMPVLGHATWHLYRRVIA